MKKLKNTIFIIVCSLLFLFIVISNIFAISYKDRHQRLMRANEAADLGSWHWDIEKDILTWNNSMFRIYEIENKHDNEITYQVFEKSIHLDDKDRVNNEVFGTIKSGNNSRFAIEFNIVTPSGEIKRLIARGAYNAEKNYLAGINLEINP